MKFTKMQGCGNDYIYVNCFDETVPDPSAAAIRLSDRHFGIGGDGLVLICPSDAADFCMEMYNADGSRSEMCGNAIRCVGKYVHDRGLTDKTELTIETRAGIKTLWLNVVDGTVETVRVCMGSPEFRPEKIPVAAAGETFLEQPIDVLGETWIVSSVNTGNPHCVTYVDDAMALDFPRIGPAFENHKMFPARRISSLLRSWTITRCVCACGSAAAARRSPAVRALRRRWLSRRGWASAAMRRM